jgi:hypothetical protein
LLTLGIDDSSEWELAVVILLLNPSYGPNTGKKPVKLFNKGTKVFKLLKNEGMLVFKSAITKNNNEDLRDKFF